MKNKKKRDRAAKNIGSIEKALADLNRRILAIAPVLKLELEDSYIRLEVTGTGSPRLVFGPYSHSASEDGRTYISFMIELMEAVADEVNGCSNKMSGAAMDLLEDDFYQLGRRCQRLGWQAEPEGKGVKVTIPESRRWQFPEELLETQEDGDYVKLFNFDYRDFFRLCRVIRWAEEERINRKYGSTPLSLLYGGNHPPDPGLIELMPAQAS